jgi:uncharacterized protein (DUF2141 family)
MNPPLSPATCWLAVCAFATICATAQVQAADLTVQVRNLRPSQGLVVGALYDSAATFLKPGSQKQAQVAPAQGSQAELVFRNLAPGRYALTVFQDENGNTKLDMNALGSPIEAVGFSKDAMGQAAAPTFDQAAIDLTVDTIITINLH